MKITDFDYKHVCEAEETELLKTGAGLSDGLDALICEVNALTKKTADIVRRNKTYLNMFERYFTVYLPMIDEVADSYRLVSPIGGKDAIALNKLLISRLKTVVYAMSEVYRSCHGEIVAEVATEAKMANAYAFNVPEEQSEETVEPIYAPEPFSGNIKDFLKYIYGYCAVTKDSKMVEKADRLAGLVTDIALNGAQNPKTITRLESYYLPLTVKLFETHKEITQRSITTPKAEQLAEETVRGIDTIIKGFESMLDIKTETLSDDIEAELEVLEKMLSEVLK